MQKQQNGSLINIAILGGSFNPPHFGHLHLSKIALAKLNAKQLWWIPTKYNNLKNKNLYLFSYEQRLKLCQDLIKNYSKIKLKNYSEVNSYKLLQFLRKKYPKFNFIWVMGADSLLQFHLWKNFKEIAKYHQIAIFARQNYLVLAKKSRATSIINNFTAKKKVGTKIPIAFFNSKKNNLSSTQIRQSIKAINYADYLPNNQLQL